MDDKELFEAGCFSPEWATDENELPISQAYSKQNKDLQTLLKELDAIKDNIQEIQAKQWHLAEMIKFHQHQIAGE
jgi:hypothetical protein